MKYITEMTEQEILELSDNQLDKMFKLKMAMGGIPLVQKPIEPEYEDVAEPDITGFEIEPLGIVFIERADADEVCAFLNKYFGKMKQDTYEFSYEYKYLEPYKAGRYSYEQKNSFSVTTRQYYSKALALSIQESLKSNKNLKDDFEKKEKAYEKMLDDAMAFKDEIYGKWREVINKYDEFDSMLVKFRQYLELADNDAPTAWKFFDKAHSVTEECKEYIKTELKKGETNE